MNYFILNSHEKGFQMNLGLRIFLNNFFGDEGWPDVLMCQTSDHCGSWVRYPLAAHVKCLRFLPCLSSEGFFQDLWFPPSAKKEKAKEIPGTLGTYAAWYFPNAKLGTCCR